MELEERIGKRWSTWAGAVALLFAAGFYLQLASGHGWIGPLGKIAIAIGAGLVAILVGDRVVRRGARALGQGLIGVGQGTLFGALYAGYALYHLYPVEPAAIALVAVTAAGMALAVRHDAAPIAILAVIGGYLTPVLTATGGDAGHLRDALFAYLIVLDLGVLGVALARRWRALEWLAFVGTWCLFAGWYHRTAAPEPAVTLAWCAGFFAVFLAVPLAYHLRRVVALSRDHLALVLVDAALGFGFACEILDGDGAQLARVALGLAVVYAVLVVVVRRRLRGDTAAAAWLAVVATGFATLAVPLALRGEGITLAWALEAPILGWLGMRHRLARVRQAGALVVLFGAGHLLATGVPWHDGVTPFLNAHFASGLAVAVAAALYGWIAIRGGDRLLDRVGVALGVGSAVLGGLLTFGLVHAELWRSSHHASGRDAALMAVLAWQIAVSAGLLAGRWRRRPATWMIAVVSAAIATGLALAVAAAPPSGMVLANPRFLLVLATAGLLVAVAVVGRRVPALGGGWDARRDRLIEALPPLVVAGLLVVVSREAWQHARLGVDDPERAGWLGHMALSCAWSGFAAVALAIGFRLRAASLRIAALALFGATITKVVFVDLARVEQIYRVTSFLVLGLLLFAASWLYHRRGDPAGKVKPGPPATGPDRARS